MNDLLIKALKDIIEECPKPKLPYGIRVVEIATKALKDHSSGGDLDALLGACVNECYYSTKNYLCGLQNYSECITEIKRQFKIYKTAVLNNYIERERTGSA